MIPTVWEGQKMQRLSVKENGFYGCFFPVRDQGEKAIIVVTGSDGGILGAKAIAKFYAGAKISALALAFFKVKDTPKCLSEIPIEYIENAVCWLKAQGYRKIAVDGISKGAELALLAASRLPDIGCVIARSPSYFVCEGIGARKSAANTSSWSWRSKALPYAPFTERQIQIKKDLWRTKEFTVKRYYTGIKVREQDIIPVEQINGPILLLSSQIDTVWPAAENGEKICKRLEEHSFRYPYRHQIYETVSHYLTPLNIGIMRLLFKIEREQPKACRQARGHARVLALDWLENIWH